MFREDTSLINDTWEIEVNGESEVCVVGNTLISFNAAVGYLVRHQEDGVIKTQTITYDNDFRSVYFANHFYNFYHSAPIEKIYDYVEELALWGQNILTLWFDMHHFANWQDTNAQNMIDRMERICAKAKSLGMKICLIHLANEYYYQSKEDLRAECSLENGLYHQKPVGFYYTELCPSKRESVGLLLNSFEELLERFQKVGLDYICLFPYDQGGCTCKDCFPWAANGFYKLSKLKADLAKKYFPKVNIILSMWRIGVFCEGEWEAFLKVVKKENAWYDGLMVDIDQFIPEELYNLNKPILSFLDISMYGATPWGGFGATPIPNIMKMRIYEKSMRCQGGILYSEGIFEDINKVLSLELFRDSTLSMEKVLCEYTAYHFGTEYADEIAQLILRLEKTIRRNVFDKDGNYCDYPVGKQTSLPTVRFRNSEEIESIMRDFCDLDKRLPETVRENWRYRILYIRATGDFELLKNGGVPNEKTDEIFKGLESIYFAEEALYCVSPFTREAFLNNRSTGDL